MYRSWSTYMRERPHRKWELLFWSGGRDSDRQDQRRRDAELQESWRTTFPELQIISIVADKAPEKMWDKELRTYEEV